MTTATNSPPPDAGDEDQKRPDLQVVREPDAGQRSDEPAGPAASEDTGEHEQGSDQDGPLLDSNGDPITPQAPLDVRLGEALVRYLHGIPAFGQSPASMAESLEYSQKGDWATSSNGAKRAAHGIATLITFVLTYPLVDLLGRARTKPGPFAIAVLIAIAFLKVSPLVF